MGTPLGLLRPHRLLLPCCSDEHVCMDLEDVSTRDGLSCFSGELPLVKRIEGPQVGWKEDAIVGSIVGQGVQVRYS